MDTVLIVDDSSFIVEGLISFLKKKYRTIAAYGGAECLDALTRETPSVIILDIMMEPMDGWETLTRIKENPATRHIPVLMFSAKKISPEEAEEHRIRIDDVITKPVSPNKIIEAIEKVLTRRDFYRNVVETWKSAGISQEKIDEYLSLVTSLEVDLSLCQNMKIQYDLVHTEDKDQIQVQAVITAIEERIRQERGQIESLTRGMNDFLIHKSDGGESPGAGSSPMADKSVSRCQAAGTGWDTRLPSPLFPNESSEPLPADPGAAVPGNPSNADPDHAGAAATVYLPVSHPVPGYPDQTTSRTDQRPELVESESHPVESPGGPVPVRAEISAAPVVNALQDIASVIRAGETGSSRSVSKSEEDHSVSEANPGPSPLPDSPAYSAVLPVHDPPVADERKVIPADLDIPPDNTGKESLTGAGTDGPMPWDSPRDRKPQRFRSKQVEKKLAIPALPPRGIIARIISFVRSLFGKRH